MNVTIEGAGKYTTRFLIRFGFQPITKIRNINYVNTNIR